mmetsp:Transcript_28546/g.43174  ORF Transcript_28546/g.43174 Transcript_28546/m.43174 type:complete len:108 (+) Transcript_28546:395-718(+)
MPEETKMAIEPEEFQKEELVEPQVEQPPLTLQDKILLRKKTLQETGQREENSETKIILEDYDVPVVNASETTSLLSSRIDQVDRDSLLDKKLMSMINFEDEEDEIDR